MLGRNLVNWKPFLQISGTTVLTGAVLLLTLSRAERVFFDHAIA